MAMTPMIVIGCGGSGGKVIASLRRTLEVQLRSKGWDEGIPDAWQLLYVDTPSSQEVNLDYGEPVPATDYVSVSNGQDVYRHVDHAVMQAAGPRRIDRFIGWRPSPSLGIPVSKGAGQWRAVGRIAAFNGLPAVARRIEEAVGETVGGRSQLERLGALVGDPAPIADDAFVVVVSSLAGGTGAGIFLDVCDVIRSVEPALQSRIAGVLFTAEVFRDLPNVPGVQPNTLAALAEIMAGYLDADRGLESLYDGVVGNRAQVISRAGINYPFVVGMSTLSGTQLERIPDAYRAVTETLAATLLNPRVTESMLAHQATNWVNEQSTNTVPWAFGNAPRLDGGVIESGVVSSFGSARLSVGSARFGEYAVHRLARSVVEYLRDGYIAYGRELLNDAQASPEQIVTHLVAAHGLSFVDSCGLRELDDPELAGTEHNQVLEAIAPKDELDAAWVEWCTAVQRELATQPASNSADWQRQISSVVQLRERGFCDAVSLRGQQSVEQLRATLPDRVLEQVSQTVAQYGVPVARALVVYLGQHGLGAIRQLRDQAAGERSRGGTALQRMGEAFQDAGSMKLTADHQAVTVAVRSAGGGAYREARARTMDATAAFLKDFSDHVLTRLVDMLDQVQGQLATKAARERVSGWPGDQGVPDQFAPPPLEFCLVQATEWPRLHERLLAATTRKEPGPGNSAEVARRLVGGGGFTTVRDGHKDVVGAALTLTEPWTGGPVRFEARFSVDDVAERARLWLARPGSVFGDFLDQRLAGYLSGVANGKPVPDLADRLDRFKDGLQKTLRSATPLVHIDQAVFRRVHPRSAMSGATMTTLIAEQLPLPSGPARDIAEQVLRTYLPPNRPIEEYFGDGTGDVEGVLYVSRLAGAVHPATVTSLTAPIAQGWGAVRSSGSVAGFWNNRRARLLDEFCPVSPPVLDRMIQGWFVGRLTGVIAAPEPHTGFEIGYEENGRVKRARFPWPLLCPMPEDMTDPSRRREWLPALLETLVVSFVLVASDPEIVDGYDRMWKLGGSSALRQWITEGRVDGAIVAPQLEGASAEDRKERLLDALEQLRRPYELEASAKVVLDLDPDNFARIPYGFELYPRFAAALDTLEAGISTVSTGVGELG